MAGAALNADDRAVGVLRSVPDDRPARVSVSVEGAVLGRVAACRILNPSIRTSSARPVIQRARVLTSTVRPVGSSARRTSSPRTVNWPAAGRPPTRSTRCRPGRPGAAAGSHDPPGIRRAPERGQATVDPEAVRRVQSDQTSLPRISAPGSATSAIGLVTVTVSR